MLRLELTFLYSASGGGYNVRGRGEQPRARGPSPLRAVGRYGIVGSRIRLMPAKWGFL
jgi:hypothetical protein